MTSECVAIREASLGGLELLELIRGYERLILIDAVVTGKHAPGTLFRMELNDLKTGSAMTRHHIGFREALELGKRLMIDLPRVITIYGIEVVETRTFSESCSPELASQISKIADEIIQKEFA